jgi:hypothetical protein
MLTVRLSERQAEVLAQVALEQDRSRGAVVRRLVDLLGDARSDGNDNTDRENVR